MRAFAAVSSGYHAERCGLHRSGADPSPGALPGDEPTVNLGDLMTRKVATIGSEQSIVSAAARMRELNVGSLVVLRGDEVEGIITTWDLTAGCLGAGHDAHECPVFRHMSSPVHTGRVDMDALEAAHVMADRGITRLPVLDNSGKMVGIVTYANLSRAMEQLMQDLIGGWERPAI